MDRFALRAMTIALALFIAGAYMLATRGTTPAPSPTPTVISRPTSSTASTSTTAPPTGD